MELKMKEQSSFEIAIQNVLSEGSGEDLYEMAMDIQNGVQDGVSYRHSLSKQDNISRIEQRLLDVGTCEYLYKFARDVYFAVSVERLQEVFIRRAKEDANLGQPSTSYANCELAYNFALDVKGSDVEALAEIPVLLENAEYSRKFLEIIDMKDTDSVVLLASALKSRRPR
jgi:hypothetical protein